MVKRLCAGLAVACLAGAAHAADLSMTPIYKSRPSAASSLDGRLKAEYRSLDFIISGQSDYSLAGITKKRGPINNREVRTGMDARF